MLAGELVVGAELGEDADHHPADQVAPLGVAARRRSAVLKRLERGLVVARVPGGERAREPRARARRRRWPRRAARGPPGPRRGSRPAAARAAPAPRRSRRGRAAAGRAPRRRRRGAGRASSASRSDASSPAATSSSAGEGTRLSRNCSICAGGIAPVNSATTWPSRNAFTAGIPWTPKLAGERLVGVDVDLGQLDLAGALVDRGLERRAELAARAAPLGPEVDDDGHLARALDHLGHEVGFAHVA